jgi:uncharacterized protein YjiS (DUF1127 family)
MPISPTVESFTASAASAQTSAQSHGPLAAVRRYLARAAITRRYHRDAAQLSRFSDRDLWDLGLSRSDLPSIADGSYRRG